MVNFLLIRFSSIGDIVLTSPVIRCLKKQVDDSRLHYLTKKQYAPLLRANPYIDKIHTLDDNLGDVTGSLRQEKIDFIIDLHRNIRTSAVKFRLKRVAYNLDKLNLQKWMMVNLRVDRLPDRHIVDRNMDTVRTFDVTNDGEGLDFFIPEGEEVDRSILPEAFNDGFIALVIGAGHATKQLPPDKLKTLCGLLAQPVVLLGGPQDKMLGESISAGFGPRIFNASGKFSINQSASLIRQSRVVITPDTGLMHVAAAFRKKIISVWGNTIPGFGMQPYMPGEGSQIFEVKGLRCRPCSKIGFDRCPKHHFRCMIDLDVAAIAEKAGELY